MEITTENQALDTVEAVYLKWFFKKDRSNLGWEVFYLRLDFPYGTFTECELCHTITHETYYADDVHVDHNHEPLRVCLNCLPGKDSTRRHIRYKYRKEAIPSLNGNYNPT